MYQGMEARTCCPRETQAQEKYKVQDSSPGYIVSKQNNVCDHQGALGSHQGKAHQRYVILRMRQYGRFRVLPFTMVCCLSSDFISVINIMTKAA